MNQMKAKQERRGGIETGAQPQQHRLPPGSRNAVVALKPRWGNGVTFRISPSRNAVVALKRIAPAGG